MFTKWFICLLFPFKSLYNFNSAEESNKMSFCSKRYCYETDGRLKNVTSLENAQSHCKGNKWLLEIYKYKEQKFIEKSLPNRVPILLNSVGTTTENFVSVLGTELPSDVKVQTKKDDFLNVLKTGENLQFYTMEPISDLPYICKYDDHYDVISEKKTTWFDAVASCESSNVNNKGHLATFDGLTLEQINDLDFVKNLSKSMYHWIGYSRLTYKWNHAKTKVETMNFKEGHPLTRFSEPEKKYFVFFEQEKWEEKLMGSDKCIIICMEENQNRKKTGASSTMICSLLFAMFYSLSAIADEFIF